MKDRKGEVENWRKCQKHCQDNKEQGSGCNWWSFDYGGRCLLYRGNAEGTGGNRRRGAFSGPRDCGIQVHCSVTVAHTENKAGSVGSNPWKLNTRHTLLLLL